VELIKEMMPSHKTKCSAKAVQSIVRLQQNADVTNAAVEIAEKKRSSDKLAFWGIRGFGS
jgi:hypothetical protein